MSRLKVLADELQVRIVREDQEYNQSTRLGEDLEYIRRRHLEKKVEILESALSVLLAVLIDKERLESKSEPVNAGVGFG